MKKILAMILCLMLTLSLVACGGSDKKDEAPETTQATEPKAPETTQATEEQIPATIYKITVVDDNGAPFSGIVVQLCNDTGCNPAVTDENGTATYYMAEARDDYHANVTVLPEGYEYASGEVNHYFENGSTELTIVLKAVAEATEATVEATEAE